MPAVANQLTEAEREACACGADALMRRAVTLRRLAQRYSDPEGIVRGAEADEQAAALLSRLARHPLHPDR
jgi:hypothetical protein